MCAMPLDNHLTTLFSLAGFICRFSRSNVLLQPPQPAPEVVHTTQFPALVHCIFLAVTVFPSRQPAKHRPAWRILVPIFMIQRCLHFVDTFEALIYYIRWYKLKKGGPTLSVDSPNIDQHKKSALLCSKALSGAPSGTLPRSKNAPLGRFCPPDRRRARAVLVTRWCTRLNLL